jgi:hypothetical protein
MVSQALAFWLRKLNSQCFCLFNCSFILQDLHKKLSPFKKQARHLVACFLISRLTRLVFFVPHPSLVEEGKAEVCRGRGGGVNFSTPLRLAPLQILLKSK